MTDRFDHVPECQVAQHAEWNGFQGAAIDQEDVLALLGSWSVRVLSSDLRRLLH